jgi:hypothetical protein
VARRALAAALVAGLAWVGGAGGAHHAGCAAFNLRLALGPEVSEATGQHTLALRLENRGPTCTLDGYPTVVLADAGGPIPFAFRHGGDQMLTSRPPALVVVRTGRTALVLLNHYRCDLGDRRLARVVRLGLPGARRGPTLALAIGPRARRPAYCGAGDPGSTMTVSPFEPSLLAALRRA